MTIQELNTGEDDIVENPTEELEEEAVEEELTDELPEDGEESEGSDPEVELTTWQDDDGNEWEIPAAIAPSLMKNKDYTTKTQTHAEEVKAFQAQQEAWKQQQARDEEDFKLEGELFNVEQRLEGYKNVDWSALRQNDPDGANGHFQDMQLLQQRQRELSDNKQARIAEKSQAAQQNVAKRMEEARQWSVQNIPNFGPELVNQLEEYAKSIGYSDSEMQSNVSPAFMRILYDGYTGNQIKQNAKKPKAAAKSNVSPLKQIKAKSTGTNRKDPDKMSMEEYKKWRKAGNG